ncbi:hypothetical protein M0R45_036180 [Rubus argutus]|uniref:Uncharacterized protein n=1 Tax=Rubus argutus TaxID=59490 RepID=A0AAW1VYX9_RUBAR
MKYLGKTRFCLGLELEHHDSGILIHQSAYTQKMLRHFNMDKVHPVSTPMIGRSLDLKKDPFRPRDDDEDVLEAEVPYLSAIGALLYLALCTRPDISFAVNLLARYSSAPTQCHWTGIKTIFRYLKGTIDMGLFYPYIESRKYDKMGEEPMPFVDTAEYGGRPVDTGPSTGRWTNRAVDADVRRSDVFLPSGQITGSISITPYSQNPSDVLVGFADAGYLSDPHKGRSQSGYVFTMGNTAISWRSTKQTLVATSSNHAEIIALHEAVCECIWLRSIIGHIRSTCGLRSTTDEPTSIYEDNAACFEQMKQGFIKDDNTKHIAPKYFYNQQQQSLLKIQVNQVRSEDNVADLFTKSLPKSTFEKHVKSIGMFKLSDLP